MSPILSTYSGRVHPPVAFVVSCVYGCTIRVYKEPMEYEIKRIDNTYRVFCNGTAIAMPETFNFWNAKAYRDSHRTAALRARGF